MVQYDHEGYAMTLKELRKEKGLTQAACAKVVGVPMRTYARYEADEGRKDTIKSVSYTHLDVYKRQSTTSPRAPARRRVSATASTNC